MGFADRLWAALAVVVKLEDKVSRQADALKGQQSRIEDLAARVIRLEAQMEMLLGAAARRLPGN
ncbi:MAG: hypothetical protein LT106_13665 [Burkholderiaceae bacterium]|nr:hypothetical protein [Burkholderiaceae bacterium]